jgi:hypothetical protein
MTLLRRSLGAGALLLFGFSIILVVSPGPLAEGLFGRSPTEDVWLRLFGAALLALAMFHVLILRKLDDLWWWTWAIVAFDGLSALIALLHAALGLSPGSSAWPWWLYGVGSAAFAVLYVAGLARAGQEQPFA